MVGTTTRIYIKAKKNRRRRRKEGGRCLSPNLDKRKRRRKEGEEKEGEEGWR